MNILLADDERLTRLGLKSMLEELYPGAHTFSEAADGEMLLQILKTETPDLIFLDIHMPKVTGLEAFSQFALRQIPVIMLTGYAEFSYAQEALKLGALDYLLKPASLDEVKASMEKVLTLYQERRLLLKKDYELEFEKLLDLYTTIEFLQTPRFVVPPYTAVLFYFDHYHREFFKQDMDLLAQLLSNTAENHHISSTTTFLSSGEICYVASGIISPKELSDTLAVFHQKGSCTATGFYSSSNSLEQLFSQFKAIQNEECIRFVTHLGALITPEIRKEFAPFLPFCELLEKLLLAYRGSDPIRLRQLLDSLKKLSFPPEVFALRGHSLDRILSLETGGNTQIRSLEQLQKFFLQQEEKAANTDLIGQINAYIEAHYMEQIGIGSIADMIDISPNYLSRIYKMRTGENFIDHLTEIRMKKAMELMDSGRTLTVRETAEKVGYFSSRYFTKIFFKYTGSSPSAYMKQHVFSADEAK